MSENQVKFGIAHEEDVARLLELNQYDPRIIGQVDESNYRLEFNCPFSMTEDEMVKHLISHIKRDLDFQVPIEHLPGFLEVMKNIDVNLLVSEKGFKTWTFASFSDHFKRNQSEIQKFLSITIKNGESLLD